MTVEQQVRAAVDRGRPGEALLVLARAVDELRSRPSNETAEDWTLPPATSTELDDPDERAARSLGLDKPSWWPRRELAIETLLDYYELVEPTDARF